MASTILLPILPQVSVSQDSESKGLSRKQLSYLGSVYFEAGDDDVDTILHFLQSHVSIQTYINATSISANDDILSLLDAGVRKIFLPEKRLDELSGFGDRIVPVVDVTDKDVTSTKIPGGVLVTGGDKPESFRDILERCKKQETLPVYLALSSDLPFAACLAVAKEYEAIPVVAAANLTAEEESSDGRISVSKLLASSWTSDRPDGLVPTVVTDEAGIALGLVYSSQKSLAESLKTGNGVYQSRKRGLWHKGATSGDTQDLIRVSLDCDRDCLKFVVRQKGRGFCHLPQTTCFGEYTGIAKLEKTLHSRKVSTPEGSYTARLFSDPKLLRAKIMEEAEELCDAKTQQEIAFEAADLIYFALTKAVGGGVSLADIERNLDAKSVKVKRRQGDAKGKWAEKEGIINASKNSDEKEAAAAQTASGKIQMRRYDAATTPAAELKAALQRPSQKSNEMIMGIVNPIIQDIRARGDTAVLEYTHKFENATSLKSPVLNAPFPESLMQIPQETIEAIDTSFENIRKFHAAQKEDALQVETMPGVVCSRFSRPIERVGLYVPGGTAVLPSTALMLGVPAMVAGCKKIVLASPPRADGSITPEIVYIAHKIGAESIVLAGGAQAVAAMAYGTDSISKVDKILGPGNQFVTAAKMYVSNDTNAGVSIDMPAGPSEVLVIADKHANPAFVASDLLSQAEHGVDSQVVLIAIDLSEIELQAIEDELHFQASALPRVDIVRGSIEHSLTLVVRDIKEAMELSNQYAPEHLILQVKDAENVVDLVENAGSVFVGEWTPESVGDYSAGVNHSLPTYGYAKQYSGVNLASYLKYITSSKLSAKGLRNVGSAVMQLAKVEELEAHRRAVEIRLRHMEKKGL